MKQNICIFYFMFQFSLCGFCQENIFLFGLKAAAGIASFENDKSSYHFLYETNSDIGVSLTRLRTQGVGYSFDFYYSIKGALRKEGDLSFTLNYLTISLAPNKLVKKTNTTLALGPYFSLLLDKNIIADNSINTANANHSIKIFDIGASGKINQRIINNNKFIVGLEFCTSYGLINIYKPDLYKIADSQNKWTRNVSFNLGITFQYIQKE